MELKELIMNYYNSNDKTEKLELRNHLLKKKAELDLPIAFEISVLGHYDAFLISGKKAYLDAMLKFTI